MRIFIWQLFSMNLKSKILLRIALDIVCTFNIYAYDAYYLELAKRLKIPLLTLDSQMKEIAEALEIKLMEVKS